MKPALLAALAALPILASCQTTQDVPIPYLPDTELNDAGIAVVRRALASQLRDPQSAQFYDRAIVVGYWPQYMEVCTKVNGTNAYGGYVGFENAWVQIQDGVASEVLIDRPRYHEKASERCAALGDMRRRHGG